MSRAGAAEDADAVLVGGGIMSVTLGLLLARLQPDWRIVLLETRSEPATESSAAWNNAGTGHAGYCELNYMPDPEDPSKAHGVASQFMLSREWWAGLAAEGVLSPAAFIHRAPHLALVFGERNAAYLRRRWEVMRSDPLFAAMEFTTAADEIAQWAPLTMRGRHRTVVAATRHTAGTDLDYGALTRQLAAAFAARGGELRTGHRVRGIRRLAPRRWSVTARTPERDVTFRTRFVFVGAGGATLPLLQTARIPEIDGFGVLPVGAAFYRCAVSEVVAEHAVKVYGQAAPGAPPMSIPHLDRRTVDGAAQLMFGPYATFSTKLLKHGRLTDAPATLRPDNASVVASAVARNLPVVGYLVRQLLASDAARFGQLQQLYPGAERRQWELIHAGQRAQIVAPDAGRGLRGGRLQFWGTRRVITADRSLAGLLGASPGASTSVAAMIELLSRCFPEHWPRWQAELQQAIPGLGRDRWTHRQVEQSLAATDAALAL
ncbi:malate:quinone oxidoreductase [Naumannella halotolerans]|uniref:Probable malate:quinone oxidoreductase n=1 Tax=Naumannella halotolerans TaxID=993414 RepID=A0A4V3EMX0_9ACTN|nr:malate:quinone oxidoreductase [Naumannella halotolerans]TDT31228.1 malate dehydrogenase (quinone) [Naumannella halotolerans]